MKHTPAPWVTENVASGKDLVYVRIQRKENRDKVVAFAGVYKQKDEEEAEANAKLIASAPELLEACKYARQTLIEISKVVNLGSADSKVLFLIKQAIEKATQEVIK